MSPADEGLDGGPGDAQDDDTVASPRRRRGTDAGDETDRTVRSPRPRASVDDTVIGSRRRQRSAPGAVSQTPEAGGRRAAYAPDAAALRQTPGRRAAPPPAVARRRTPVERGTPVDRQRVDRDRVDRAVRAVARRRALWLAGACAAVAALAATLLAILPL